MKISLQDSTMMVIVVFGVLVAGVVVTVLLFAAPDITSREMVKTGTTRYAIIDDGLQNIKFTKH